MCGKKPVCTQQLAFDRHVYLPETKPFLLHWHRSKHLRGKREKKHASAKTISSVFDLLVVSIWL